MTTVGPQTVPARLWEIGAELELIGDLIAENGGEITTETEARIEALEGAFESKVERIALYVRECAGRAAAAKAEKDRLAAIQRHHEAAAAGLKRYMLNQMRRLGIPRVETPRARVRVQKNGQPSISWTKSLDELPLAYQRITVTPDVELVRDQLMAGDEPPEGFSVDYGYHVRIQ